MKKRIFASIAALAVSVTAFSGCSLFQKSTSAIDTYDFSAMNLVQLKEPKDGQDVAIFDTTLGEMVVVLYPEYAPNTVANFKKRVEEGFYTSKSFYGVESGIYALTGSIANDGKEGVTDDGKLIEDEYSVDLWPFKGAMLAFSGTLGYGDSRFFLCGARAISTNDVAELKSYKNENDEQKIPDKLIDALVSKGSVPGLAGMYTVYGQMISGFDILDQILNVEIDDNHKPKTDIVINKVTLTTYKKGEFTLETPKVPELEISETTAVTNESGAEVTTGASSN